MKNHKTILALFLAVVLLIASCGCAGGDKVLDPKNPVTVTVWHYYNGAIMNAFDAMVEEFNEKVGREKGIIVETVGMSSVAELEREVLASANQEVGSRTLPDVFASYADTAYSVEELGLLADLGQYFSDEERKEYLESFIEEGRIGLSGELRIFPIAKASEALMINDTDWLPFAEANGLSCSDLSTFEGVARVSALYYEWTEEREGTGKALFGRDSMANMFIVASKQFGTEIFSVSEGKATVNINEDVTRKIWDYYYLPYIQGHYFSYGRFRSDDTKVGDILTYIGSTSSASYFPDEVTQGGETYPISCKVLPVPGFEGTENVMVQQGAGMVVLKSDKRHETASVTFLKWFTETRNNIEFCALSGYLPVKKEAQDFDTFMTMVDELGLTIDDITRETLRVSLESIKDSEFYTNKAFANGAASRSVLEHHLQDKAAADREAVIQLLANGKTLEEAVAVFNTEENYQSWLAEFTVALNGTIE